MQILTQSLIFSLQLKNWNKNGEISIFWLIIASQMPWHLKNFQDSLKIVFFVQTLPAEKKMSKAFNFLTV